MPLLPQVFVSIIYEVYPDVTSGATANGRARKGRDAAADKPPSEFLLGLPPLQTGFRPIQPPANPHAAQNLLPCEIQNLDAIEPVHIF